MKISVIIPVYNVERYLEQCLKGVLEQTYKNLEILLIDDGSTDSSGEICDIYAARDGRIRVIHKQNGGLSDARNVGIDHAAGEYLIFLDSDDYWDDMSALENLVAKLEFQTVDVLNYRYKKYIEATGTYIDCLPVGDDTLFQSMLSQNERTKYLLQQGLYIASACNKLIKREFVVHNALYFRKGITSEDIDWCARVLLYAGNISYINSDFYVYRQREQSITHTLTYKSLYNLKNNILECVRLGESIAKDDAFYEIYHTYVAYQYGTFIFSNNLVKDDNVKQLVEEMREYRWLLRYNSNKKIKALYYLNRTFGYCNMIRCMKLYSKFRKG